MGTKRDLEVTSQFLRDTVLAGASLAKEKLKEARKLKVKGRADFASDADLAVERLIVTAIKNKFPEDGIVTEEELSQKGANHYDWVLDPIDGTTNYIRGVPFFCVSLALLANGVPLAAAIADPLSDRLYHAVSGNGAFRNQTRLSVNRQERLELATVGSELSCPKQRENNPLTELKQAEAFGNVRCLGSTCLDLALTAEGIFDLVFFQGANPWDTAAGVLLIEEAGGLVTTWEGTPYQIGKSDSLVAGNESLLRKFCALLALKKKSD